MENSKPDIEQSIELLKISQDSYKHHFEWVVRIFVLYFVVVGALFGFVIKTTDIDLQACLYSIIILGSGLLIYAAILIKVWLKKYEKGFRSITTELNTDLDYLYFPAKKGSTLIIACCSIILLTSSYLFIKVIL